MEFNVTSKKAIELEYWNTTYSGTPKTIKIAGMIVTVMCISLSSNATCFTRCTIHSEHIECIDEYVRPDAISSVNISNNTFKLNVFAAPQYSKSELNRKLLLSSFTENCPENEYLKLSPLYNFLSEAFLDIDFKKAIVDVVPSMSMVAIDFNLGHRILLSVSKSLDTISNDKVVFSISVAGDIRTNDVIHLNELVRKIKNIQQELS